MCLVKSGGKKKSCWQIYFQHLDWSAGNSNMPETWFDWWSSNLSVKIWVFRTPSLMWNTWLELNGRSNNCSHLSTQHWPHLWTNMKSRIPHLEWCKVITKYCNMTRSGKFATNSKMAQLHGLSGVATKSNGSVPIFLTQFTKWYIYKKFNKKNH